jgi:two-component system, response regulator PdtaR
MPTLAPPKKILTVDDNAIVSADVRSILEAAGYDVCPDARDGVQAVEHVRRYDPDLILLDLQLPRMDGVEAASLIREESDAPILVLTGYDDSELLERAEAAGTSGLVLKPFSENGLLSAVRTRLAQRDSEDFGLRCMVESMLRDGAGEESIVRALGATTGAQERTRARRQGLRAIVHAWTRRRARGAAA